MRFAGSVPRHLLPLLTSMVACARGAPPAPTPAGHPAQPDGGRQVAPSPVAAPLADAGGPDVSVAAFDGRSIEIACNGKDDDDDGFVDVLLPVGPNACDTGRKGACGSGFALCAAGERLCVGPPPMPEVADGVDNDCNGVVDDVPDASVRPRAVLLAPRYAWSDAAPDLANAITALAQAGIPFDRPASGSDWASVAALDQHTLAIVPGYLLGSALPPVKAKLEAFVERGGVLVVFKPIPESNHAEAMELAGLRGGTRHRDVEELRFDGAASPATGFVDSVEERSLGINAKGEKEGVEVWTFEPEAKTEVLGRAFRGGAAVGAAVTRRRLGKGAVYAIGHDLASFGAPHCYLNCFEAAGDFMRLMFDGALREGSRGHVAVLATAPALASSVLVLTHDVNTHESQFSGSWGEAGALQFAKVEKERGVRATFHVMTDYRSGEFNAKAVRELCALGMCPSGIQGVARVPHFDRMGDGMVRDPNTGRWKCKESLDTYTVPSLCGEVFLSSWLVQSSGSQRPRSWRSPYLAYHAALTQMLVGAGVPFDSSFGIGDLPVNVPLDLATTGIQQRRFQRQPLLEFPLACDDGLDVEEAGEGKPGTRRRIELQPSTEARFRARWEYVLVQNQRNRSFTTLRVNPSRGENMGLENVRSKALILGRWLDTVSRAHPGVAVRSIGDLGDFWRARLEAQLEARFDNATGYVGTLTVGKTTAPGLVIEFGDAVDGFHCPKCGETRTEGKRVAILQALSPGTTVEFSAKAR